MCHTGKVMNYDTDGHRVKGKIDAIDWLHARLMKKQGKQASDFHLRQCLFGEHLLPKRPKDIVCLTESEKPLLSPLLYSPPSFGCHVVGNKVLHRKDVRRWLDVM